MEHMQGEASVSPLPLTGNLSIWEVEYFAQRYLRGGFIISGSIKSSHSILEKIEGLFWFCSCSRSGHSCWSARKSKNAQYLTLPLNEKCGMQVQYVNPDRFRFSLE